MAEAGEVSETNQTTDFSFVVSVSAVPGEDVILPVRLSAETSAVSMNISWYRGTELIYQYKNGLESTNNDCEGRVSLSIQELERGNLSLTLRNVQESDSGEYKCQVYHNGCQKTVIVHLQVRGERRLQRQAMEQWRQIIKLQRQSMELQRKSMELQRKSMELQRQMMEPQEQDMEPERRKMEQWRQTIEMHRQNFEPQSPKMELHTHKMEHEKLSMKQQPIEQNPEQWLMKLRLMEQQTTEELIEHQTMELKGQIKKLNQEKQIKKLEEQIKELSLPTHTLHGPTPRRRHSITRIPPHMSEEDTPDT